MNHASVRQQVGGLPGEWHDWRWQMRHRLRCPDELMTTWPGFEPSEDLRRAAERFPMAITPYYASLVQTPAYDDPIFRMAVPSAEEGAPSDVLACDPLEEDAHMPVPGLIHRYRTRALILLSSTCPVYCRYCNRKRHTGVRERLMGETEFDRAVAYLRAHAEVNDVILSGGDPLMQSTDSLRRILEALRTVPSIGVIRIGTRVPVTLPMRVDPALVEMLRCFQPIWINTHFNHPAEMTADSYRACARIADAGIVMGNQSVLLKGVNDDGDTLCALYDGLIRWRVRPYYLFQCDLVEGVDHFRTPLETGIALSRRMRRDLSGIAVPAFVVDTPGLVGKVPLQPCYVREVTQGKTFLETPEGATVAYPEPV